MIAFLAFFVITFLVGLVVGAALVIAWALLRARAMRGSE